MIDRTRLADALASATVEQLVDDAAMLIQYRDAGSWDDVVLYKETTNRLAALALALAMLEDETDVSIEKAGAAVYVALSSRPDLPSGLRTLPAALAALLRGAP